MKFSANLGFLYTDLPLVDRIHAAAAAGFDAVECHFPYDTPPEAVAAALSDTGLAMLGLNTHPGDLAAGDFGLAAMPGRGAEARAAVDQAVDYAVQIDCAAIHVMAGKSQGQAGADAAYRETLAHAVALAETHDKTILIEPINHRDVPGYFLNSCEQAAAIIADLGSARLKILFDCYHLQILQGDLLNRYGAMRDMVGHIQFAAVPDRAEPDHGELDYPWLLPALRAAGYTGAFGAEYKPAAGTAAGLGWMADYAR